MANPQLISYISQLLQKGYPEASIRQTLLTSGWPQTEIDSGFASVSSQHSTVAAGIGKLSQSKKGFPKKIVMITALVIFLLLGAAGGIFGYSYLQSPERKLAQVITNMDKINTFAFDGEVKMNVNVGNIAKPLIQSRREILPSDSAVLAATDTAISINFNGSTDGTDKSNPKAEVSMKLSGSELLGAKGLGFEMRSLDKLFFFKLTNIPEIGLFDLTSFSNQWIKLDVEEAEKFTGSEGQSTLDVINQKKFLESYKKRKIVQKITKLEDEKINDKDTYHYQITIDKKELLELLKDLTSLSSNSTQSQTDNLTEAVNGLEINTFEYWIGKKDLLPYRLLMDFKSGDNNTRTKVQLLVNLKNYNQPVTISAPSGAKTFDEIFREYQLDLLKKQQSTLDYYNQGIYLGPNPPSSKLKIN